MLVFDVSSLIYIENGLESDGWYIIPAGEDVTASDKLAYLVTISADNILLQNGHPLDSDDDIYIIYSAALGERVNQAVQAVHNQQVADRPVTLIITNEHDFTDRVIEGPLRDAHQNDIHRTFIFHSDVVIAQVSATENLNDNTSYDVTVSLQNSDGSLALWTFQGAESTQADTTTQFMSFQIGLDGTVLAAREFVTAFETAPASFALDNYVLTLDENISQFDFTEMIVSSQLFGVRPFSNFQLEGAPAGFTISDDGLIRYEGDGFDFETAPPEGYDFTVKALSANGQIVTSTVSLTILDVNDEAPLFEDASYRFNQGLDTETIAVATLSAIADTSDAVLSYAITGGDGVDKFVLGDVEDGTDIVTDFNSIDRIIVQIDSPLATNPTDLADLLTALGLSINDDSDRTNNGAHDTVIMQGATELMVLEGIDAASLHISHFEVEVV